ncbi:ABC transporter ATP-binding protein [Paenibacillus chitinolyticus]|uniref:ABC transporter ATP-binding protein n=1 Tax=Paenibacillus chitinolyticus TaxID=79263 RepID=A0A410WYG4_9BACL|nr:ABC transporter ATP-binding protein [Paenibacillus chitinolyticus]MCY9590522.1 ABC transporter ATP-binding protein [Paenibacillus chitinolyticus]QAV19495.1 ABC transporter ATP-binding protein [Paenibacillus chitinolyticus]
MAGSEREAVELNPNHLQKTVLHARQVRKSFGARGHVQQVLRGIDLRVLEGEFIGIMGPSGSGKSTLINVLATLDKPTEGEIAVDNADISAMKNTELSTFRRKKFGFIFQDYNLLDTLTVKENILLPVSLGKMKKEAAEAEYQAIAADLGILELAHKYPHEISGGQRQRTSAARALIHKPSIVFADEPTGALDSKSASSLLEMMERLNRQRRITIMMVTHDPVASSYCSRVVFLKDGMLYSELYRGGKTRQAFFKDILNVQAVLGGDHVNLV